jgi:hypothetical protein
MQSAQRDRLIKGRHFTSQFDSCEYERWSDGITATQSFQASWGIETFFNTNGSSQPECEVISPSPMKIGEKMTIEDTTMVQKHREWKRPIKQLQNWWRQLVGEFYSVVANEENRIARWESDTQLPRRDVGPHSNDKD